MKNFFDKNRILRSACLILSLFLVFAFAVSCNRGKKPEETESETTGAPEKPLDPVTVRIMYSTAYENAKEFVCDESAPGAVDSAVAKRTKDVEKELNATVKFLANPSTDWSGDYLDRIKTDIKSGDNNFDVFSGPSYYFTTLLGASAFKDLSGSGIDFGASYYAKGLDSISLGKRYFLGGEITPSFVRGLYCILFDRTLTDADNLYSTALNGGFTLEELGGYIKNSYNDVDGNLIASAGDTFGLNILTYSDMRSLISPLKLDVFLNDGNGIKINRDPLISSVLAFFEDGVNNHVVYVAGDEHKAELAKGPSEHRSPFTLCSLGKVSGLVGDDRLDFGILPLPKLDEHGEYTNTVCSGAPLLAVSSLIDDEKTERICGVLDLMFKKGSEQITAAFISDELLIDNESKDAETVNLIRNGATFNMNVSLARYIMEGYENDTMKMPDSTFTFALENGKTWEKTSSSVMTYWEEKVKTVK